MRLGWFLALLLALFPGSSDWPSSAGASDCCAESCDCVVETVVSCCESEAFEVRIVSACDCSAPHTPRQHGRGIRLEWMPLARNASLSADALVGMISDDPGVHPREHFEAPEPRPPLRRG